jgi:hypothetical protein
MILGRHALASSLSEAKRAAVIVPDSAVAKPGAPTTRKRRWSSTRYQLSRLSSWQSPRCLSRVRGVDIGKAPTNPRRAFRWRELIEPFLRTFRRAYRPARAHSRCGNVSNVTGPPLRKLPAAIGGNKRTRKLGCCLVLHARAIGPIRGRIVHDRIQPSGREGSGAAS